LKKKITTTTTKQDKKQTNKKNEERKIQILLRVKCAIKIISFRISLFYEMGN